ncbi:hypothetical protein [Morganella morganii]|uniref:hypothetical protein n=1 Tax=Morganella morganii TaxID=582 RepID=UPI00339C414E
MRKLNKGQFDDWICHDEPRFQVRGRLPLSINYSMLRLFLRETFITVEQKAVMAIICNKPVQSGQGGYADYNGLSPALPGCAGHLTTVTFSVIFAA